MGLISICSIFQNSRLSDKSRNAACVVDFVGQSPGGNRIDDVIRRSRCSRRPSLDVIA